MDVFSLRDRLVEEYSDYIRSFIQISDDRIREKVRQELESGALWPEPLIQLNPAFEAGATIDELVEEGTLHPECRRIFRIHKGPDSQGKSLRLHRHQEKAIRAAATGDNYVLTTGTGSGKSLAYIVPIVDHVLREGTGKGIQAIVVYPMNALANSQMGELEKFLGPEPSQRPVQFKRYTGQEDEDERREIIAEPPDILLTNYVMLELILTRRDKLHEEKLVAAAGDLRFLVFDELHTYRGRQGADVALLIRRTRNRLGSDRLQTVGTSATLAGPGTLAEQREEVARVATLFFGDAVRPERVIGETVQRATEPPPVDDPDFVETLRARIQEPHTRRPASFSDVVADPLSRWIESVFGVQTEAGSGRLIRAHPRSLQGDDGAARKLSEQIDVPEDRCARAITEALLAGYDHEHPETGFPVFAFRLHQFISRGETVYASLEPEDRRHLTLEPQHFVPGDRDKILLPLAFCRQCGQEYYSVRRHESSKGDSFVARELSDRLREDHSEAGFLYFDTHDPWPDDVATAIEQGRIPDDWVEEFRRGLRVRRNRRVGVPESLRVGGDGRLASDGVEAQWISAPFRFCLRCGVAYSWRQRSDFGKLTTLGSEGRSTATTILSLNTLRNLRDTDLPEEARKLLSFTDNRQDASLQAGHFNDFVAVSVLRAGLYKALEDAGPEGLSADALTQAVFEALRIPFEEYAVDPEVQFLARDQTHEALREVLGYRLYRDLLRGWRVTSPNLEHCGLLQIEYQSLDQLCRSDEHWESAHPALAEAKLEVRARICHTLLDFLRRELSIKVRYLDQVYQEKIEQKSRSRLREPWGLDEQEEGQLDHATVAFPRPKHSKDYRGFVYVSSRGGFGQYLRRSDTLPDNRDRLKLVDTEHMIRHLFETLRKAGILERVQEPMSEARGATRGDAADAEETEDVPGYQINAAAMVWKAGDGSRGFHDPIRVPRAPEGGAQTNEYFIRFYQTVAHGLRGLEAREHTAQVPQEERQDREERFRTPELPVLFCSPTMELGVDISFLNVVNLRNIPPTPANYAQRSGRAGRSGQPALVLSYCASGSPHDQYFFKRPEQMVRGQVQPPRIDLANEDLIQAHVQAMWLTETGQGLGKTLKEVLDLSEDEPSDHPSLELLSSVRESLSDRGAKRRAKERAESILKTLEDELAGSDWYDETWVDHVLAVLPESFEACCERWRTLYRSALNQVREQNKIIQDPTRPSGDKREAKRLREEAESQLGLLTDPEQVSYSDFYSYRYFASEGFLPGYNFPRLPLSAYIPGRRQRRKTARSYDEFLARPRFLAISEFGPQAIVYHEGSRYQIHRVILPVGADDVLTTQAKQCHQCGYLHPIDNPPGPDLCERCGNRLGAALRQLFRLRNVSTRRRDRINSDEEERLRLGYEIRTGVRFAEKSGRPSIREAEARSGNQSGEEVLATLSYGHAATVWRINMGWSRRTSDEQDGFVLDLERGTWGKNKQALEDDEREDPMSDRIRRVIPYVEDRKNSLLLHPSGVAADDLLSLQAALKNAIQVVYQLEDNELAAEVLPDRDDPRLLLFYEAAEGGAGVLRRLLDDSTALGTVATEALRLCHFDPETGEDLRIPPRRKEPCEAACYDCLMSYTNQRDHTKLDRHKIKDHLLRLRDSEVTASGASARSEDEHLQRLRHLCDSDLEHEFLDLLAARDHRLPTGAQERIDECSCRPDFVFADHHLAVFVDGPIHDHDDKKAADRTTDRCLERLGWIVLRFDYQDKSRWPELLSRYPSVFGKPGEKAGEKVSA